jgi:hypothetical protein
MTRVRILHAHVRACYTFCRCVTAKGFVLTDRHTVCWRYLSACLYCGLLIYRSNGSVIIGASRFFKLSTFFRPRLLKKGQFRSYKPQDSATEGRGDPSQLFKSWDCLTSKFQLDLHQYLPYWMRLSSVSDVLLRLQTNVVQSFNLAVCRRLEGNRPVLSQDVYLQDNTNRR